jgi:hypothetical protein
MLRTHRSREVPCATLWWRWRWWLFFVLFIVMEHRWNEIYRGKPKYSGEKLVPEPLCPPQIPHGLTRDRTRASAVGGRRLPAWAMARPGRFFGRLRRNTILHQPPDGNVLCFHFIGNGAVPWLRRLAAGLPSRKSGFDSGPVRVGFVVDKVALGQFFLRVLQFSPVSFIPPVLHYYEKDKK